MLVALPLSWLLVRESIGLFERRSWNALGTRAEMMHSQSPGNSEAEGQPAVMIVHERFGAAVLPNQALPGVPVVEDRQSELLHRFRVRKHLDDQPSTNSQYEPDLLIVELCRERFGDTWHFVIEIGYQSKPGHWQRIAWWQNNGIAPSNELIRFEEDPYLPRLLRKISMPCTIESATAFIAKDLHKHLKDLNPDYKSDPRLSLKSREFETGVAQEFNRILPEYTGSLAASWPVFMALTISGGLQAFMVLATVIALLALLCRTALFVLELRWAQWLKKSMQNNSPRAVSRLVADLEPRVQGALGLALPSLAGANLYFKNRKTADNCEKAQQHMAQLVEENDQGSYFIVEMIKCIVYLGLLGTLTYLVWALLTMRIDSHTGKMQSILSITANTMAGAFLTTCASSTLARLIEFLHVTLHAAEVRRSRDTAAWLAEVHDKLQSRRKQKSRPAHLPTKFNGKAFRVR